MDAHIWNLILHKDSQSEQSEREEWNTVTWETITLLMHTHQHTQTDREKRTHKAKISRLLMWLLRPLIPMAATQKSRFVCYPLHRFASVWLHILYREKKNHNIWLTRCFFHFLSLSHLGGGWYFYLSNSRFASIKSVFCHALWFEHFVASVAYPIFPDVIVMSEIIQATNQPVFVFLFFSFDTTSNAYTWKYSYKSKHLLQGMRKRNQTVFYWCCALPFLVLK